MGIYIKGMKKPSDCQYCVMYRDGYCGAKGGFCRSEKGVDADCPIVEVVEVNESEIPTSSENSNNCETCKHWEHGAGNHYYCARLEMRQDCHYEPKTEPQKDCKKCKNYDRCKNNRWKCCVYEPKDESTRSKMEQVDKDTNVRSKEPYFVTETGCEFYAKE